MPVAARRGPRRAGRRLAALLAVAFVPAGGCASERCGPSLGEVARVVDGDTIDLSDGTRIRYLLVDTPEISGTPECYGPEAKAANEMLVAGATVDLAYDEVCEDKYGRLLAYVSVGGREINLTLVERGYACVLSIPPNGAAKLDTYLAAEQAARTDGAGLWGTCMPPPC